MELYKIPFDLIPSRYVKKLNRFVLIVRIKNKLTKVYMPNPGRLSTILTPNRILLLKEKNSGKYRYEVFAAKMNGFYATLDPKLANILFERIIKEKGYSIIGREVKTSSGRIDFLLKKRKKNYFAEVKSCTHVENGIAKFPDRKTERGKRHLKFLIKNKGILAIIVQRPDAKIFSPFKEIDPDFAELFRKSIEKIKVFAFSTRFNPPKIYFEKEIPIKP
jgi:sugar fermentation stimulation protein A